MSIISCVWNISWWVKWVKWLFGMDAGKMINLLCPVQSSLVYRRLTHKGFSSSLSVTYMIVYIHPSLLWQELIACSGRREQLQTSWGLTRCSDSIIDLHINTEARKNKKIKKQRVIFLILHSQYYDLWWYIFFSVLSEALRRGAANALMWRPTSGYCGNSMHIHWWRFLQWRSHLVSSRRVANSFIVEFGMRKICIFLDKFP